MDIGLAIYRPGPADFGSPLKMFDYLASGLAVVASPHPQMEIVLREAGQSDQVVPHGDADALAAVLLRLAADPSLLRQPQKQARSTLVQKYTWEHTVRRTYAAIDEAIGAG